MKSKINISSIHEMILIQEDKTICPYPNTDDEICNPSFSALEIDNRIKMKYCENVDYDECPLFLAKSLIRKSSL